MSAPDMMDMLRSSAARKDKTLADAVRAVDGGLLVTGLKPGTQFQVSHDDGAGTGKPQTFTVPDRRVHARSNPQKTGIPGTHSMSRCGIVNKRLGPLDWSLQFGYGERDVNCAECIALRPDPADAKPWERLP